MPPDRNENNYSVDDHFPTPIKVDSLQDVLTFWYPPPTTTATTTLHEPDPTTPDHNEVYLNDITYVYSHIQGWMMGGQVMDEKCRHFCELTRQIAANSRANENDKKKQHSEVSFPSESMAKLILFDQIARNAFRYQTEAFAYDDLAAKILLQDLFQFKSEESLSDDAAMIPQEALTKLVKTATLCDCFFIAIACQHQEKRIFRRVDNRLYHLMEARWPAGKEFLKQAHSHADSHNQVLERFGRYPHRNHVYGREHTVQEREWLEDYDNLPMWVKSQLPQNSTSY